MIKLLAWQQHAVLKSKEKNLALFAEAGTGKTCAVIHILKDRNLEEDRTLKTLIVAPPICLFNWHDELQKFYPEIPLSEISILHGSSAKRKKILKNAKFKKFLIINYEAILSKYVVDFIDDWMPEACVLDEAHYLKNPSSKRSKVFMKVTNDIRTRIDDTVHLLTGTPILNSAMDLWAPFFCKDGGRTFGKSFYKFLKLNFYDANARFAKSGKHFPKYVIRSDKEKEVKSMIDDNSIVVKKKDCMDLPPLVKVTRYVELEGEQKKHYGDALREAKFAIQEQLKLKTTKFKPEAVFMKLRQIMSGFIILNDEVHYFSSNAKLHALPMVIDEIPPEESIIIWCNFKAEYKMIGDILSKLNISHCFITGEQTQAEKEHNMRIFNRREVRILVGNQRAAGIGVNLVAASYSIVFSRSFDLNASIQSEARNYRKGSEIHEKVTKIDLLIKDSLDMQMYFGLKDKNNLANTLISAVLKEKA